MKNKGDAIAHGVMAASAVISAVAIASIFIFMGWLGSPLLFGNRLIATLTRPWAPLRGAYGVFPMIVGTAIISLMSLVVAFPMSLGAACLASFLAPRRLGRFIRGTAELMTAVPTVVYGLAGLFLLVPLIRETFSAGSGLCALSAALMLALIISPTMIIVFCDAFERTPAELLQAAAALGASPVQKLLYVALPCSGRAIAAGLMLALGRAMGDTMIALMLAGNAVQVPGSLLDSARTLTSHIALVFASDYESLEFKAVFACGVCLYFLNALAVLAARLIRTRSSAG